MTHWVVRQLRVFRRLTRPLALDDLHRDVVNDRAVGDDDAGGMCAGIAIRPFQSQRDVDPFARGGIGLVFLAEVGRCGDGFLYGGARLRRDPFGHEIDAVEWDVEHAAHVLDRGLGGHGAESGDLGDALLAVGLLHIFDDLLAAILAEVDVDVGQPRSGWGQAAAQEQQVILQVDRHG